MHVASQHYVWSGTEYKVCSVYVYLRNMRALFVPQ